MVKQKAEPCEAEEEAITNKTKLNLIRLNTSMDIHSHNNNF